MHQTHMCAPDGHESCVELCVMHVALPHPKPVGWRWNQASLISKISTCGSQVENH